jgi:hypothetical protein
LVCRFTQAALKIASWEKWCAAFLEVGTYWTGFSVARYREVFHRLGAQDVTEFDSD